MCPIRGYATIVAEKGVVVLAKSPNQKLKLLYLSRILQERTDEEHSLTVRQMIEALEEYGISAERKSIYDDLEALRLFGLDIAATQAKSRGYFLANREFELPELKLLADAVASSKFITEKKSNQLIKKIEGLASNYEARQLQRQVFVSNRVKTMNEKVYYNVDAVHQAISAERQVSFCYFDYNTAKEKVYRGGGETRKASPYALVWDDENYYMVAYYEKYETIAQFRIDKMERISVLEERCVPRPAGFDAAVYSQRIFSMYGGEEEVVRLRFDDSLIGVVLDRFGKDVPVEKLGGGSFAVRVHVAVSPTFLGWLFQFGGRVSVLSPQSLIDRMREQLETVTKLYSGEE